MGDARPKFPGQVTGRKNKLDVSSLIELEDEAGSNGALSKMVLDYYQSGSDSQITMRDNRDSYSRFKLVPRMLTDVSRLDCRTSLFGTELSCPLLVAPMAMQAMAHPEGELAVARACKACGVNMILSTMANHSMADVAGACDTTDHLWFQLYVFRNRDMVRAMVQDAERLGYRALVVTVDAPFLGNRESDEKNRFAMPRGLTLGNADRLADVVVHGEGLGSSAAGSGLSNLFMKGIDDSLTWDLIAFLKSVCGLPVLVKGVLHPGDAELAVEHGADGIIVSNHGGRQLDTAVAAIDVVQAISHAVHGRIPVILDGGVRRGTDILKALALGADAVCVGRPVLYALAKAGQSGVEEVLQMLKAEFKLAMALAGCESVGTVSGSLVVHQRDLPLRSAL